MKMTSSGSAVGIEMTKDELEQLTQGLAALDAKLGSRGIKRCCDCQDGNQYTIEESNDLLAFFKCLSKCGPRFQMSNNPCSEDRGMGGVRVKNSNCEIKYALSKCGVIFSDEEISQLASGGTVQVNQQSMGASRGLCSGIKIADFGNGCGLYLTFNGGISYCCEF